MIQALNEKNPKQSQGNSVKFLFILLGLAFAALIGATWHTVNIAMAGHEPVIDKFYYEKGMNYEKEIAKSKQMQIEGYRFESTVIEKEQNLKKGNNEVQVKFLLKDTPVNTAKLFVTRERTATSKFTEKKELGFDKDGVYKANIDFPDDGKWLVTLTATVDGRSLEKAFMVTVK